VTPSLPRSVIDLGHGFYNLRGSFRLFGIDLKTQASLVRLSSGGFVLLDAIELDDAQARWLDAMTDGGDALEAVLHLHPFHTISVRSMHERYPNAKLHGTPRHRRKKDDLPWDDLHTDEEALHARYADDLAFTVPRGVELIPADENVHFSSVLVTHAASRTLHVDDTLPAFTTVAGDTTTTGVVVHPFEWLSFHYNESENFRPLAGDADIFGNPIAPPTGEGEDYGFCRNLDGVCGSPTACVGDQAGLVTGTNLAGRCVDGCETNADCDEGAGEECVITDDMDPETPPVTRGVCRAPGGECSASPVVGTAMTELNPMLGDDQCIASQECSQTTATEPRSTGTCVDRM